MTTSEHHLESGKRKTEQYLADKVCSECDGTTELLLVYSKRWWAELGHTLWSAKTHDRNDSLSRATVLCRECVQGKINQIKSVLESKVKFSSCQELLFNCLEPVVGRGFCVKHRTNYMKMTGVSPRQIGKRGEGHISEYGYKIVYAFGHPNANKNGTILEHRKVMTEKLGRPLREKENAHHKNGNKLDNRPQNLELWVTSQPRGQRPSDLIAWAQEIIGLYGEEVASGALD